MASGQQVLPEAKQIVNRTVHRQKVLCVARRFEPAHVAFPLASRLMRDFGAVIHPLPSVMHDTRAEVSTCCSIAARVVGHDRARHVPQPFQQLAKETLCGTGVPSLLHENIEHFSILVYRTPQIMTRSSNRNKHFIEIPRVTQSPLAPPNPLRERCPEL